ncbi:hypothetical protein [Bacillus subtilis]|uniref:hypothetical protein n=1 Tax=Bacillus subtilis TaxID=1423 RepID=UPI0011992017|nr:hypothetical protein [Bacillus subtilis]TWG61202.1 hypothetical protein L607_000800000710 [Bacillus subtilis J24]TWG69305.1 hypothetical protein L605_000600001200 [Bacillus subtilis J26]WIT27454.1 hypothetical protein [Bacillus phage SPbetaL4]WIT27835.1 hypothetical protein [Bacillus phage SPbetaL6]
MKMRFYCLECESVSPIDVEINEKSDYVLTCPNGHRRNYLLQLKQFELLYELGAHALIDGYTREAVTSFAVSVERLYEYCIKIFMIKSGVSKDVRDRTFKMISNSSERQLGAFYFLYLNEFKESPEPIKNEMVNFRNKVTHKGEIPSYKDTLAYAEYIFNYIIKNLRQLRTINNIDHYELQYYSDYQVNPNFHTDTLNGNPPIGNVISTMIGTSSGDMDFIDRDFTVQFQKLKSRQERWLFN